MKEWRGWHFPDGEEHLIEWMRTTNDIRYGRPTYQAHKYDEALLHCKQRRVAVDVGANIGLWSWLMGQDFKSVEAFEPVAAYADCWEKNVSRETPMHHLVSREMTLHPIALGADAGHVSMVNTTRGSCGDTTVDIGQGGTSMGEIEMRTLDSFGFDNVDLLKVDAEGYELFILEGAIKTLKRCKPVVVVEQKPGHGKTFGISDTAAIDFLKGLGMRLERMMSGDYILSWRPQ